MRSTLISASVPPGDIGNSRPATAATSGSAQKKVLPAPQNSRPHTFIFRSDMSGAALNDPNLGLRYRNVVTPQGVLCDVVDRCADLDTKLKSAQHAAEREAERARELEYDVRALRAELMTLHGNEIALKNATERALKARFLLPSAVTEPTSASSQSAEATTSGPRPRDDGQGVLTLPSSCLAIFSAAAGSPNVGEEDEATDPSRTTTSHRGGAGSTATAIPRWTAQQQRQQDERSRTQASSLYATRRMRSQAVSRHAGAEMMLF